MRDGQTPRGHSATLDLACDYRAKVLSVCVFVYDGEGGGGMVVRMLHETWFRE